MSETQQLILNGVAVRVLRDGVTEQTPDRVGARARALSGRDAGRVRAEYRPLTFPLDDLTPAEWRTLRLAVPSGRILTCSGTLLPGPGLYRVQWSSTHRWEPHAPGGAALRHVVAPTVTLTEAGV